MVRVVLTFIYDKLLNYSPLDWITVCTNYYGDASAWDFGTTVAGTSRLPRNLSVRFLFYRCASISNSYHFKEPFLSVWKWCSSSTADINTFTRVLPSRNPLRAMKKLHAATITRRKTHSLFFFFFFSLQQVKVHFAGSYYRAYSRKLSLSIKFVFVSLRNHPFFYRFILRHRMQFKCLMKVSLYFRLFCKLTKFRKSTSKTLRLELSSTNFYSCYFKSRIFLYDFALPYTFMVLTKMYALFHIENERTIL